MKNNSSALREAPVLSWGLSMRQLLATIPLRRDDSAQRDIWEVEALRLHRRIPYFFLKNDSTSKICNILVHSMIMIFHHPDWKSRQTKVSTEEPGHPYRSWSVWSRHLQRNHFLTDTYCYSCFVRQDILQCLECPISLVYWKDPGTTVCLCDLQNPALLTSSSVIVDPSIAKINILSSWVYIFPAL